MSLNKDTQIIEEEYIIELFRNEYTGFPKGKLQKTESPDFILKGNPKSSIGIELTKLHGPASSKENTHFTSKIRGYQTPEFTKENLEFTISAKDEKLRIYQQKMLDQIWLLIIADLIESPVSLNLMNKLQNWIFFSGFHKVFLLDLKTRKVFELNVSD
ncbi:MAG: hypothetical protein Q8N05_01040 [Bacteroidota bacterium]|nr:hypothetical protein [Bacteroidota bacterium]